MLADLNNSLIEFLLHSGLLSKYLRVRKFRALFTTSCHEFGFCRFVLVGHEYLSGVLGNQEERTTVNEGTKQIDGHT